MEQTRNEYFLALWIILFFLLTLFISPIIPLLRFYEILSIDNLFFYTSIILMFLYVITLMKRNKSEFKFQINQLSFLTILLFLLILLIQLIYLLSIKHHPEYIREYYFRIFTNTFLMSSVMFFLGLNINVLNNIIKIKSIKSIVFIGFWLYVFFIFYGISINSYLGVFGFRIYYEPEFNYLNIADSFVIYAILTIALIQKVRNKIFVFVIALIASFALASRTSTVFFGLSIIMYITFILFKNNKSKVVKTEVLKNIFIIILLFIVSVFIYLNYFDITLITNSRLWNLISNGGADNSLEVRNYLLLEGIEFLKHHWLTGAFGEEVYNLGPGTYIHNWFSFLGAYGIIPFMLSLIIMVLTTVKILKLFLSHSDSPIIDFLFVFNSFVLFSIWFSRAYTYEYIWFTLIAISLFRTVPPLERGLKSKKCYSKKDE
ncbi:hypothetical protein [Sediminibacillus halophilus]|uniref:O-antigen ligase n=1 Tax=Sediminibacillus halophilus TaxID=482461 RepID=A0A1G9U993_9BACI|nr:hypothetical protein [Sediminibacillus halophilus]SDM56537.1 hypothetical protein SAMN05216244_2924 [Sediminibacillus halophilus]